MEELYNLINTYFIIGFSIYITFITALYVIGIDNVKEHADDENVKELSETSILIGLFVFCVVIWPITFIFCVKEKFRK